VNPRSKKPVLKQPTPQEVLDSLLGFVEAKFYRAYRVNFEKDKPRLLQWVILWPARWFERRGVTVPADRYGEILKGIIQDAHDHGNLDQIKYLPAWLKNVVERHFAHQGDELYEEAKTLRSVVEHNLAVLGRFGVKEPDVVREFAAADRLLKVARSQKRGKVKPVNDQLSLI